MTNLDAIKKLPMEERYEYMMLLLKGQLANETDPIANLSNASAIIYGLLDGINWAGFYIVRGEQLVLGPFQGLPACNRINIGEGVCGTAAKERKTQIVKDVHDFPGHIACDTASNSEIVIPILKDDKIYGVLDIDSPEFNRFGELEYSNLTKFVDKLNEFIPWERV